MVWFRRRQRKVRCPDGSHKFVFRNPADAFPLAIRELNVKTDAALKGLHQLEASASTEVKQQLQAVLFQLGADNQSTQLSLHVSMPSSSPIPVLIQGIFIDGQTKSYTISRRWHSDLRKYRLSALSSRRGRLRRS